MRERLYSLYSDAANGTLSKDYPQWIEITHSLHPGFGRRFLFDGWVSMPGRYLHYAVKKGSERIRIGIADVSWTDLRSVDPFERASGGRSLFRVDDLRALSELISSASGRGTGGGLK